MALIRTLSGDTEAAVQLRGQLLDIESVTFSLPLDDRLVAAGALNAWQPIGLRIRDGNTRDGSSQVSRAMWVTSLARQDRVVQVTAMDGGIWMRRRNFVRPSDTNQSAGNHLLDLLATAVNNRETRYRDSWTHDWHILPTDSEHLEQLRWFANPFVDGWWGNPPFAVDARASSTAHALTNRQSSFAIQSFTSTVDPLTVRLLVKSLIYTNVDAVGANGVAGATPVWNNTAEVSLDGGETFGTAFVIAPVSGTAPQVQSIDLTPERTWTAADLTNVVVRCTVESNISNDARFWSIYGVAIQCDYAAVNDSFPLHAGSIDTTGPLITLPDAEQKSFEDWLKYLMEQTNYEWAIASDSNQLGTAELTWAPQIGGPFSVTVMLDGEERQVAALDEGGLVTQVTTAGLDGTAIYSQVRVTAKGLSDVVQTNDQLADDIGIHELLVDLGDNATATDQANTAAAKLVEVASPAMQFEVNVARIPGLWASLTPGTTATARLLHAPVNAWQGTVRIIRWALDESNGVATLNLLTVADAAGSTQPVGSGQTVTADANTRKRLPLQARLDLLAVAIKLARRLAR